MSSMNMFVRLLLEKLLPEKPVGQDFHIVRYVLGSLVVIAVVSMIAAQTGNPVSAVTILGCGLFAFALAILCPDSLFETELAEDYRSFLPHCSKHLFRDLTEYLELLSAHLASLLCLAVAPLNLLTQPSSSCEAAAQHSAESRCLLLASTHVLRAPPRLA